MLLVHHMLKDYMLKDYMFIDYMLKEDMFKEDALTRCSCSLSHTHVRTYTRTHFTSRLHIYMGWPELYICV